MTNAQGAATPLLLLHAYLDGELDPINSLAIAQQIAADPVLGAEVEHIQALRHAVRERLPREPWRWPAGQPGSLCVRCPAIVLRRRLWIATCEP